MNDEKQKENKSDDEPYTTCPDCGQPISFENDAGNGFCKDCAPNH